MKKTCENNERYCLHDQRGMAALLTVLIVSASVLIMAYSASILGLGDLDLGYTSQKGAETFSIANGCMEESLRRLKLDTAYSGGSLNFGDGSCTISVSGVDTSRIIVVSSTLENYHKKIQANVNLNGNIITINDWFENTD